MNMKNNITAMLGMASLALAIGSAQAASPVTFSSVAGGDQSFTYTGGPGGGLSASGGSGFTATYDLPAGTTVPYDNSSLTFTGLSNVGTTSTSGSLFDQILSAGTFNIVNGTTTLLSGSFTGADLMGKTGASTKSASLNTDLYNVTYTGGKFFTDSGVSKIDPNNSLSFSFLNIPNGLSVSNGSLNSFTASGSGQFQGDVAASTVPEPATIVPFVLGGLALLGLVVRKTRRVSGAAV